MHAQPLKTDTANHLPFRGFRIGHRDRNDAATLRNRYRSAKM